MGGGGIDDTGMHRYLPEGGVPRSGCFSIVKERRQRQHRRYFQGQCAISDYSCQYICEGTDAARGAGRRTRWQPKDEG